MLKAFACLNTTSTERTNWPMVVFFSTMLTHRGLPGNLKPKERKSDRIVFKLFGKDPNELPVLLRNQILNWLSQSPTDIEGYINAGCIILSLCYDLGSNLRRLPEAYNDSFWRTGWIYTRVLDHVAFACDVSVSETAQFSVKGFSFSRSTSTLTCALEGSYLIQTKCSDVMDGVDSSIKHDHFHSLTFSCFVPDIHGRGFIEEFDKLYGSV
ncbi:hypothetical protein L2E82_38955 [Cichorium intybus]|uniref:Uncharacterized protein n=1 Tax=Cichorium intybus TaxID=13427 RepID=A0ACB9AI57_CICIN|nr:hypothetical protein L2E82_38955 [Cichorium intybus]